jgi:ribose transport system substrate-binding protein
MNIPQQIEIMEELIAEGVDGIALCATDPNALIPMVNKAISSGIPTITFESDMPHSDRICFLGTDNYRAGQHLAEVLARELNYTGKAIICTGLPTQLSLNQVQPQSALGLPEELIRDRRDRFLNRQLQYSGIFYSECL